VGNEKKLSFGAPIREYSGVYRRGFYGFFPGPLVHAVILGVFYLTSGDLPQEWDRAGLCLGIMGNEGRCGPGLRVEWSQELRGSGQVLRH